MMESRRSMDLYEEAKQYIPGGVNSPVRAFASVGMTPRMIQAGIGSKIFDVDGNEYLDYVGSWGPMVLGHNHSEIKSAVLKMCEHGLGFGAATEIEVEMAKFICKRIPSIEMIRMVNSGTEAVMSAIRLARAYTKRDKIIKFEGCYHGHSDALLVKAGSGLMTGGLPDSSGVPRACVQDTLTAPYNDLDFVEALLEKNEGQVAAIIVEPLAANMGLVPPKDNFLSGLRKLCDTYEVLLIFDEVITGFRLSFEGASGFYGVKADLTTYGKIIGGGLPVGAYGGKRKIMEMVAPIGPVYQAGTLSGNPIAMAAGLAQLRYLYEHQEIYRDLIQKGERLFGGIQKILFENNAPYTCNHVASLGSLFFTGEKVVDYASAKSADTDLFADFFVYLLERGIYIGPSQFEAMFLSHAHTKEDIDLTLEHVENYIKKIRKN